MRESIVTIFVILDDLCSILKLNRRGAGRRNSLSISEVAVISLIRIKYSIRNWKSLYDLLNDRYSREFHLPCYKNFVMSMNKYATVLTTFINIISEINQKQSGEIKIVDSTQLPVCKNLRIPRHKTMKNLSSRSRSTTGWFYGLKLHIMSDLIGNILKIKFTTANIDDRVILKHFLESISNSIILADAGYISKELEKLAAEKNNILLTCKRKSMKKLASYFDIWFLNLRPRIEFIFSILKERLGLITSLPRSVDGYLAHYVHVLFGYLFKKLIS